MTKTNDTLPNIFVGTEIESFGTYDKPEGYTPLDVRKRHYTGTVYPLLKGLREAVADESVPAFINQPDKRGPRMWFQQIEGGGYALNPNFANTSIAASVPCPTDEKLLKAFQTYADLVKQGMLDTILLDAYRVHAEKCGTRGEEANEALADMAEAAPKKFDPMKVDPKKEIDPMKVDPKKEFDPMKIPEQEKPKTEGAA